MHRHALRPLQLVRHRLDDLEKIHQMIHVSALVRHRLDDLENIIRT